GDGGGGAGRRRRAWCGANDVRQGRRNRARRSPWVPCALRLVARARRRARSEGHEDGWIAAMKYQAERELVIKYAVEMEDRDLTVGTSGNVSMRVDDGAIITPSTIPYKEIRPEDCCLLDLEGGVLEGEKIPS